MVKKINKEIIQLISREKEYLPTMNLGTDFF